EGDSVFRAVVGEVLGEDGVDLLGVTEHTFRVLEVLEVVGGPHPVRTPAGHHDGLVARDGAVERGGHGGVGAIDEVEVAQAVNVHRAVASGHEAGTGVDTDDLATEHVGVVVELGNAVDLDVGGNGPTDVGAVKV